MAGKEGERSSGQLIRQNHNHRQEPAVSPQDRQEGSPPALSMDPEVLKKLSYTPKGEDPAFWPIRVLNELEDYISIKDESSASPITRAIGQKYSPYEESIHHVKTAYSILAYPRCQYEGWKEQIGFQLELHSQSFGEDQVTLTDPEFHILNQIATARKINLDPKKRVYSHSEVPTAPHIDPYGRRRMTTEEIREYLHQSEGGKSE